MVRNFSSRVVHRTQVEMVRKFAFDYKIGRQCALLRPTVLRRLATGIGALAAGVAVPPTGGEAERGETALTCTNLASGADWQINIAFDRSTADSKTARMPDAPNSL